MARVIKAGAAGAGQKPRPATRVHVDAGPKKVIERAVYQAKQDAEHILMRAEQERHALIADGKKQAAHAKEGRCRADRPRRSRRPRARRSPRSASARSAMRRRATTCASSRSRSIRKILGGDSDLGPAQVDKILQRGIAQLRARRRLRLQVSHKRLGELGSERRT